MRFLQAGNHPPVNGAIRVDNYWCYSAFISTQPDRVASAESVSAAGGSEEIKNPVEAEHDYSSTSSTSTSVKSPSDALQEASFFKGLNQGLVSSVDTVVSITRGTVLIGSRIVGGMVGGILGVSMTGGQQIGKFFNSRNRPLVVMTKGGAVLPHFGPRKSSIARVLHVQRVGDREISSIDLAKTDGVKLSPLREPVEEIIEVKPEEHKKPSVQYLNTEQSASDVVESPTIRARSSLWTQLLQSQKFAELSRRRLVTKKHLLHHRLLSAFPTANGIDVESKKIKEFRKNRNRERIKLAMKRPFPFVEEVQEENVNKQLSLQMWLSNTPTARLGTSLNRPLRPIEETQEAVSSEATSSPTAKGKEGYRGEDSFSDLQKPGMKFVTIFCDDSKVSLYCTGTSLEVVVLYLSLLI